jgi:hypothetical protein
MMFQTPRLHFRLFEVQDLEELASINADQETSRHVGDGRALSRARPTHARSGQDLP